MRLWARVPSSMIAVSAYPIDIIYAIACMCNIRCPIFEGLHPHFLFQSKADVDITQSSTTVSGGAIKLSGSAHLKVEEYPMVKLSRHKSTKAEKAGSSCRLASPKCRPTFLLKHDSICISGTCHLDCLPDGVFKSI